jgi:hypothetical protein
VGAIAGRVAPTRLRISEYNNTATNNTNSAACQLGCQLAAARIAANTNTQDANAATAHTNGVSHDARLRGDVRVT